MNEICHEWFDASPPGRFPHLRALLSPGIRILDIGNIGKASFSSHAQLQEYALHNESFLVGCDGSVDDSIRFAYKNQVVGLLQNLPFADASFDLVYMGEVIEHVWEPLPALMEAARVLRPSGRLVLDTPNALSLGRIADWWIRHKESIGDPDHKLLFTPVVLAHLLTKAGFNIQQMTTDRKLNLGRIRVGWIPGGRRLGAHLLVVAVKPKERDGGSSNVPAAATT